MYCCRWCTWARPHSRQREVRQTSSTATTTTRRPTGRACDRRRRAEAPGPPPRPRPCPRPRLTLRHPTPPSDLLPPYHRARSIAKSANLMESYEWETYIGIRNLPSIFRILISSMFMYSERLRKHKLNKSNIFSNLILLERKRRYLLNRLSRNVEFEGTVALQLL